MPIGSDGTIGVIQSRTHGGKWYNIEEVSISLIVTKTTRTVVWKTLGYQRVDQNKNHTWMIMGRSTDGNPVDILVPLVRVAPGRYKMGIPSIIGNVDIFISLGNKGYPTKFYTSGK
ncbi:MAG: hypothetical protein KGD60_06740 [Candidatus Thorarchaeota archaeon]|nr:hypothetical protein [Candidatus Thorarchaeota archaeon]